MYINYYKSLLFHWNCSVFCGKLSNYFIFKHTYEDRTTTQYKNSRIGLGVSMCYCYVRIEKHQQLKISKVASAKELTLYRRRLKGIHSRPDTNRTGAEGLSFYYPRLLYCLDQMLAVMSLSQHRVSSSKTVRPRAPCGAQCIGHAVSTWSAVCSEEPHSQFGEEARPYLCMDEWKRPTPVRRRLSLTQATRVKPIPTGLAPDSGTKARSLEAFSQYSVFRL